MVMMFDSNDYRSLEDGETYAKKFVILDPEQFKPEFRSAKFTLFYANTGFGCDPSKLGGKVFGTLFDENYQTRREFILGVATEDAIKEWENYYGISRDVFIR